MLVLMIDMFYYNDRVMRNLFKDCKSDVLVRLDKDVDGKSNHNLQRVAA